MEGLEKLEILKAYITEYPQFEFLSDLKAYITPDNRERAEKAEEFVYAYLQSKGCTIKDFRFPKELTDKITNSKNPSLLNEMGRLLGTKFDFMAKFPDGRVCFIDAKGHRSLGECYKEKKEAYDRYWKLSALLPFYIYKCHIPNSVEALFLHTVRNPKGDQKKELAPLSESTYPDGKPCYIIPQEELQPILHGKASRIS